MSSVWNDFRNWLLAFTALLAASYGCGKANRANDRLDVIEQKLNIAPVTQPTTTTTTKGE